jgi:hypothetical protein
VGSEAANELVPLVGAEDQVAVLAERPVRRTTEEHPDLDVRDNLSVAEEEIDAFADNVRDIVTSHYLKKYGYHG